MHLSFNIVAVKKRRPKIRLELLEHRNKRWWALRYAYNDEIRLRLKQLNFIKWSRTHHCFYMAREGRNLSLLIDHFRGRNWIDLKNIYLPPVKITNDTTIRSLKSKATNRISSEVLEKIDIVRCWMEQKRYAPSTIKTYIGFIKQFFAAHPGLLWDGLTLDLVEQYNHHQFIEKKHSYSTQNQWINAIKMYCSVHHLDTLAAEDILRPRRVYQLPDVLTLEEVTFIFRSLDNMKHKSLLMLIYGCGLRIGEALALKLTDIQSAEGLIYVRSAKGNKDRRVPLSDKLLVVLRQYVRIYRPQVYLYEGDTGGQYSASSARQVLKRAVRKVGIKKRVTLHTLRHSYATHLTQKGVNIQYIQEILGHRSPKTTMLYTHLSGKDIRNIKSPLDDLDI